MTCAFSSPIPSSSSLTVEGSKMEKSRFHTTNKIQNMQRSCKRLPITTARAMVTLFLSWPALVLVPLHFRWGAAGFDGLVEGMESL